jgi:HPr kinase/phosphorylase
VESITIEEFFRQQGAELKLEKLSASLASPVEITVSDINRTGMLFTGFTDYFLSERIQIVGQTEIAYLATLGPRKRKQAIERLFGFTFPCLIITKGFDPPREILSLSADRGIPILRTTMSTTPFIHRLTAYLDRVFAPQTTIHGTLVDVYGVGLLFTGRSAIGKSECALDLVERGHRLVADDVVTVIRRHGDILIGTGNPVVRHHMEIRGLGIIDVQSVFGIRSIRFQKRVEVEVNLQEWKSEADYERTGLDQKMTTVLGVKIPLVVIPIFPGKNITVIAEVIALNYLVKVYSHDPAKRFNKALLDLMQRKSGDITAALGRDEEERDVTVNIEDDTE